MELGFYYHIAIHCTEKGFKLPAYLGLFIDSLANEVEHLTLFMHEATKDETTYSDYTLIGRNIDFFNLGKKTPAWERFLWPKRTLSKISQKAKECDVILVRAPSPLAPAFKRVFDKVTRVCYMIVGDYAVSSQLLNQPWWRKKIIVLLSQRNDRQLTNMVKNSITIVNSTLLLNKYKKVSDQVFEVKTTTLSNKDFFKRLDTCQDKEIKILYTGRIDLSKGLFELVLAFKSIAKSGYNVSLHFAGWEDEVNKPIEKYLRKILYEENMRDLIQFHGRKTIGHELNALYQMADIYVIPSYQEGFPRTIWEAMANSLPVITTKVGSIPYFLNDHQNALLIEPRDEEAITIAINEIIVNGELRKG